MAVSSEYKSFIAELFEGLFPVRIKPMFGGAGVYAGDVMFALIVDETLYLKADKASFPVFEEEGSQAFTYERAGGKSAQMGYWSLPERLYDDPDDFRVWAMRALDTAMKSKAKTQTTERARPQRQN